MDPAPPAESTPPTTDEKVGAPNPPKAPKVPKTPSVPKAPPVPVDKRITRYGLIFKEGMRDLEIELYCFRIGLTEESGGLGKAQHFKNVVDRLWGPNSKKKFVWHPWAEAMLNEACNTNYLAVAGCASSGKTDFFAVWGLVNWLCAPLQTMVIVTSTSLKESRRRIWGSVRDYFLAVPGLPGKLIDSMGCIRVDDGSGKNQYSEKAGVILVAGDPRKEKEAVGKLIGIKNKRIIFIADELSELSEAILSAALPSGNLASNPYLQLIGMSNPNSYHDPFGKLATPRNGWNSVSVLDDSWDTVYGRCLHFDAFKSPNVIEGRTIYPFLPTQQKIDEALKGMEETSSMAWRMLKGFWCPTSAEDRIYSEGDIVRFKADIPMLWAGQVTRVAGLDPSFTNGGDRTMLYLGTYGLNIDGIPALNFDRAITLNDNVENTAEPRSYQIARQFREICEKEDVAPENAAFDVTGAGNPFGDIVRVLWSDKVHRIAFGGAATDRPTSLGDPSPANERYANRVSEIWFSAKELIRGRQIGGICPDLAKEMCARKFITKKGATLRLLVEPKEQMKITFGRSPDMADAAFLLVDLCRQRFGFGAVAENQRPAISSPLNNWSASIRRFAQAGRSKRLLRTSKNPE